MSSTSTVFRPDIRQFQLKFEPFLRKEYRFGFDPDRPVCPYYQNGECPLGDECPNKHNIPNYSNKIVCKHWLRGLCKKGDNCEFLHEYNLRKMPECQFFSKNGFCTQTPDCLYLHIDPLSKIPSCEDYDLGFCPKGESCSKKHVRKVMCPLYLYGFCPKGPECELEHPKWIGITEQQRIKPDKKPEKEANVGSDKKEGEEASGGSQEDAVMA